jgi:hypothetical protein
MTCNLQSASIPYSLRGEEKGKVGRRGEKGGEDKGEERRL